MYQATITLDNDDIIAGGTFNINAPAGVGYAYIFDKCVLTCKFGGGGYTVPLEPSSHQTKIMLRNVAEDSLIQVSGNIEAFTHDIYVNPQLYPVMIFELGINRQLEASADPLTEMFENHKFAIKFDNNGTVTGGHVANTMIVSVLFQKTNLTTGAFV